MSEAIAFFGGIIAMTLVWFWTDMSINSPYRRGYRDGYTEATKALLEKGEQQ